MTFAIDVMACNCARLRKAARQVGRFYDMCLAETGLLATQFTLLAHIHNRPGIGVGELAELISADRATMGHNLRPLERDGFVAITKSKIDRRARELRLTAKGTRKLADCEAGWKRAQKEFEKTLGAADAKALRAMVDRVSSTALGEPARFAKT